VWKDEVGHRLIIAAEGLWRSLCGKSVWDRRKSICYINRGYFEREISRKPI